MKAFVPPSATPWTVAPGTRPFDPLQRISGDEAGPVTHSPRRPHAADATSADERRFLTMDGVRWTVRLLANTYDRRSRPDLVFESDYVVRRVRDYPENWRELPDEALFALSASR